MLKRNRQSFSVQSYFDCVFITPETQGQIKHFVNLKPEHDPQKNRTDSQFWSEQFLKLLDAIRAFFSAFTASI